MADQEVNVESLVITVSESGVDRRRKQQVIVEFVAFKPAEPPGRQRVSWKVTISQAVIEKITELFQQYQYSLSTEQFIKDVIAKNPFTVDVQTERP